MKHLSRFAAIPFGFVVIAFAIANRHTVEVSLDPLPFVFEVSLYLVAIGGLAVGFAAGAAAAWLAGHAARRRWRVGKARIASLEGELSRLRASQPEAVAPQALAPERLAQAAVSTKSDVARLPADAA